MCVRLFRPLLGPAVNSKFAERIDCQKGLDDLEVYVVTILAESSLLINRFRRVLVGFQRVLEASKARSGQLIVRIGGCCKSSITKDGKRHKLEIGEMIQSECN